MLPWLKEQRESLNNTLLYSPLNKNREDISDLLRGKIIQLDELINLTKALKEGKSAEELIVKLTSGV